MCVKPLILRTQFTSLITTPVIHSHACSRAQKKLVLVFIIHHATREIFSGQTWNSFWSHPTIWSKVIFVVKSAEKSE